MSGETRRRRLRSLLASAGVEGVDLEPFECAFEHASAAGERGGSRIAASNERLEFLGDAVLGYVVARWLYQRYAAASEGELARRKASLASDEAIAQSARRLGFGELLVLGQGERSSGGAERESNLGDAFEAFVAVLALEAGMPAAIIFVETQHLAALEERDRPDADPKTALQELTQAQFREAPLYHDEAEEGPAHARQFWVRVALGEKTLGHGTGTSKKAAQQAAAREALAALAAAPQ